MKKILMTMLIVLAGTFIFAQTYYTVNVSGFVVDDETGDPLVEAPVWLMTDSITDFFYYNMVFTNNDGFFEDSFDVDEGIEGVLFVSVADCEGVMITNSLQFSENNSEIETIFSICGTPDESDCEAAFYAYPASDDLLTLQFMDVSTGFPTSWEWDFGDGETSDEQNPLHTYPDMGEYYEYLVSLSISNDSTGCTSYVEMVVGVGDSIIWEPDSCMAMFYSYPSSNDWMTMQFMDISIGNPDSWEWDFGDGTYSEEQNPLHTYAYFGEYLVSLTISNEETECTSTMDMYIMVGDTIWYPDSCMAMFYACPDSSDFMTMHYIDMSIGEDGNPPANWYWEFGDGSTSEDQNPSHTYTEDGEYEVCLTIFSDDESCVSTYCEWIYVMDWDENCEAMFYSYPAYDTLNGESSLTMQFVDYSYGNPNSWAWEFGDGATSSEQNPLHTYDEAGIYEVCLTIENQEDSCESTICEQILVFNDTIFDCYGWFEYEMDDLTVGFFGYLENSQEGDYTWDFGDGTTGTGQNVTHTYAEDGIYIVTMSVVDSANDCYATYSEMLWVGDDFSFDIEGYIYLEDSNMMADYANVYLMTFDTIFENLISVAETEIDENGYYLFEDVSDSNCIYFIQAELTEASAYYEEYIPTYHLSAMTWEEAYPVFPFPIGYTYDVYLLPVQTMNAGPGIISGTVGYESDRSGIEDVNIMLLDTENTPYTYRKTDDAGYFDFSDIAYGTYVVYTEIMGIETTPVTIDLNEDNTEVSISIVVANGEAVLGIGDPQSIYVENISDVYPNPVTENASMNISMTKESTLVISIQNNYGQTINLEEKNFSTGKHKLDLETGQLPKGIYFISIQAGDGVTLVKKLVKL